MEELFTIKESTLEGIANAIREKTEETGPIAVSGFAEAIRNIKGGSTIDNIATCTLTADGTVLTFEHNLGYTPSFCFVFLSNPMEIIGVEAYKFLSAEYKLTAVGGTGSNKLYRSVSTTPVWVVDDQHIEMTNVNSTYKLAVGKEYSCLYW